jgi:hypothetical protein
VAGFSGAAIERQGAMTMGVLDGKVAIATGTGGGVDVGIARSAVEGLQ